MTPLGPSPISLWIRHRLLILFGGLLAKWGKGSNDAFKIYPLRRYGPKISAKDVPSMRRMPGRKFAQMDIITPVINGNYNRVGTMDQHHRKFSLTGPAWRAGTFAASTGSRGMDSRLPAR